MSHTDSSSVPVSVDAVCTALHVHGEFKTQQDVGAIKVLAFILSGTELGDYAERLLVQVKEAER